MIKSSQFFFLKLIQKFSRYSNYVSLWKFLGRRFEETPRNFIVKKFFEKLQDKLQEKFQNNWRSLVKKKLEKECKV